MELLLWFADMIGGGGAPGIPQTVALQQSDR
jgi:hypothetical protein